MARKIVVVVVVVTEDKIVMVLNVVTVSSGDSGANPDDLVSNSCVEDLLPITLHSLSFPSSPIFLPLPEEHFAARGSQDWKTVRSGKMRANIPFIPLLPTGI